MTKNVIGLLFLWTFSFAGNNQDDLRGYDFYHQQVITAEILIGSENYAEALLVFEQLFSAYEFVFLREYQVAVQLAWHARDKEKALKYIKQGILSGWEMKSIKKNKFLTGLRNGEEWKLVERAYPDLRKQYEAKLNQDLRDQVKTMYSKDQKKALKALFRFGSKAQDSYAEKKFAPHSEEQMAEFTLILKTYGYPGEKLIGNSYWASTILSHHNSISKSYNKRDTIYPVLRPKLMEALKWGQISPYEFAIIDDWNRAIIYERNEAGYGILDRPSKESLFKTNDLRNKIYARPYELRDELEVVQQKTGMDFYLPDRWY